MKKIELYTGDKTYMFPNGDIATKERMLQQFPAILTFTHIIETDDAGEVAFAVQNLSAMCSLYQIDLSLSTEEKIAKIEEIINTEPVIEEDTTPSTDERIAAALEAQVMMSLPDDTTVTE